MRLLANDVAASLGLPKILDDGEINQEFPIEVSDIYAERKSILNQPLDEVCFASGANAYKRLLAIRDSVISQVYTTRNFCDWQKCVSSKELDTRPVFEIERNLAAWVNRAPEAFRLGANFANPSLTR